MDVTSMSPEPIVTGSSEKNSADNNVAGYAPASGWLCNLAEAPDAAFAEGMLGPGIAIEPLSNDVRAPFDGRVAAVADARHAVTIQAANGAQLLIHVGIDTVALGGEGFDLSVREGQEVRRGDLLLRFDPDTLVRRAKSLIIPIILTNADEGYAFNADGGADRKISEGDPIFRLRKTNPGNTALKSGSAAQKASRRVPILLRHGLHARPAARIAAVAKEWDCEMSASIGDKRVNAKSPTGIMGLGAGYGATLVLEAIGADAQQAVDAVGDVIEAGAGDDVSRPVDEPAAAMLQPVSDDNVFTREDGSVVFKGVAAAPGAVVGPVFHWRREEFAIAEVAADEAAERKALSAAIDDVRRQCADDPSEIAAAHAAILDDDDIAERARGHISAGKSAAYAWRAVMREQASAMAALGDERMRQRAADFEDLERRVIARLLDVEDSIRPPPGAIVVSDDFYPSEISKLKKAGAAGLAMAKGGATSHASILAAAVALPAVPALGEKVLRLGAGEGVILDADRGVVEAKLSASALAEKNEQLERRKALLGSAIRAAVSPCVLASGERIATLANLAGLDGVREALAFGAEGCGLLRTEFLFLGRTAPPSEEEQTERYREIIKALDGRPVVIRTLDIGADKPAAYLPLAGEDNPALGVRGVRVSLRYPMLLQTQLRAILRAADDAPVSIMAPMIANVSELLAVRGYYVDVCDELNMRKRPPLGVMVETPAAAMIAPQLAIHADFMSVGTNDLTQYALAADRCNPALAESLDACHPAVLSMIGRAARACRAENRWIGVCGGLASDIVGAPLLAGLGVTELSATAAQIPKLKVVLRTLDKSDCETAAHAALELSSAEEVREETVRRLPSLQDWI